MELLVIIIVFFSVMAYFEQKDWNKVIMLENNLKTKQELKEWRKVK